MRTKKYYKLQKNIFIVGLVGIEPTQLKATDCDWRSV